jgi:hypothetical protein
MKPTYGVLLLVFLLWSAIVSAQKENNSVLDQKITLNIQNQPITSILDSISSQVKVFFSYDAILIEADKQTNLSVLEKSLQETLDTLFHSKFEYQVLGDQIIIADLAKSIIEAKPGELESKINTFRGRVIDRDRKEVLPYTGISILRSHIGTISNIDGNFELKIPASMVQDTIVFSHLGYRPFRQPISEITAEKFTISLQPATIQLKEIQITLIDAQAIVNKIIEKIPINYPHESEIMTAFYREILKQDDKYIDVAEAVMEIMKAPYENNYIQDRVKVLKGRKSHNVEAYQFVDFKMQGGPFYITQLDAINTLESFLNPDLQDSHKYWLEEIAELDDRKTYVIQFKPKEKVSFLSYQGKIFVDMSTLALVRAEFSLTRSGLKVANQSLIKKKPKSLYVRPLNADYFVSYRRANNKWHLSSAQAAINFKVKSKTDRVNSIFSSVSDLLITDFKSGEGKHFKRDEVFSSRDIFTESISSYDDGFWGDYNTITPSEELRDALQEYYLKNDSLFKSSEKGKQINLEK